MAFVILDMSHYYLSQLRIKINVVKSSCFLAENIGNILDYLLRRKSNGLIDTSTFQC